MYVNILLSLTYLGVHRCAEILGECCDDWVRGEREDIFRLERQRNVAFRFASRHMNCQRLFKISQKYIQRWMAASSSICINSMPKSTAKNYSISFQESTSSITNQLVYIKYTFSTNEHVRVIGNCHSNLKERSTHLPPLLKPVQANLYIYIYIYISISINK